MAEIIDERAERMIETAKAWAQRYHERPVNIKYIDCRICLAVTWPDSEPHAEHCLVFQLEQIAASPVEGDRSDG